MAVDPVAAKRALRTSIRSRRRMRGERELRRLGAQLAWVMRGLVQERSATRVACYLSGPHEPGTRGFLDWALEARIPVLLPVLQVDGSLDWVLDAGGHDAGAGVPFPEPTGDRLGASAVGSVDLLLIPAAAVDADGFRMGWGRGAYDRTLAAMDVRPPVHAVVFEDEFPRDVPREPHDRAVDGVVTPAGAFAIRS